MQDTSAAVPYQFERRCAHTHVTGMIRVALGHLATSHWQWSPVLLLQPQYDNDIAGDFRVPTVGSSTAPVSKDQK